MSTPTERTVTPEKNESEKKLEEMLRKFETDNKDMEGASNLRTLISGSEPLRKHILEAIEKGKLAEFVIDVSTHKINNHYNIESRKLSVSQSMLKDAAADNPQGITKASDLLDQSVRGAIENPEQRLSKILTNFESANSHDKKPDQRIRDAIESSPALKEQLLDASGEGYLTSISVKKSLNGNAGGGYSKYGEGGEIKLPAKVIGDDKELLFTLGHEAEHARNKDKAIAAEEKFERSVAATIAAGGGRLDFTQAIEDKINYHRDSEARAHIAGFNAVASKTLKDNPKAQLGDIYDNFPEGRRDDFFESRGKLKDGLRFDKASGSIVPDADNVRIMGNIYFNKGPDESNLGNKKNLDNKHYYVSRDMLPDIFSAVEKSNNKGIPVAIDMDRLGLRESALESNMSFPDNKSRPYIDTSDNKEKQRSFDPGIKKDLDKDDNKVPRKKEPTASAETPSTLEGASGRQNGRAYGTDDVRYFSPIRDELKSDEAKRIETLLDKHIPGVANMPAHERDNLVGAVTYGTVLGGIKNPNMMALSADGRTIFVMDGVQEHSNRAAVDIERAIQQPFAQSMSLVEEHRKNLQRPEADIAINPEQGRGTPRM